MQVERNPSALGAWITDLSKRKHHNVTAVALANKMARIAWAMLTRGSHYSASQLAVALDEGWKRRPLSGLGNQRDDFHVPNPPAATMFNTPSGLRDKSMCV